IQRILWEAACALGHAHQRGVVHRDVKPANIMFDHDGRVMLTDFGISKALQAATGFTATGMIIGTPHYMAPEQGKGAPVDGRAASPSRSRLKTTADAPTEITGRPPPAPLPPPTAPMSGAKVRPARRSRAPVVIGLVVLAAGFGGYVLLRPERSGEQGAVPSV